MSGYSALEFQEYRVRKIVNVHKHVDGPWVWAKRSRGAAEYVPQAKALLIFLEQMFEE